MRMLTGFFISALLCLFVVASAQLPPKVIADKYLIQAEQLLEKQDYEVALNMVEKIIALQKEHSLILPDEFHFQSAQVTFFKYKLLPVPADSIKVALELVSKYLSAETEGESYKEALVLLSRLSGLDPFSDSEREAILRAVRRWEEIIVGDLPDVDFTHRPVEFHRVGMVDGYIDDLRIYFYRKDLSGFAGIGAPTVLNEFLNNIDRDLYYSPCVGDVTIDPHVIREIFGELCLDYFYIVALHEIGHVLGIGTIWECPTVEDGDPYFPGELAIKAFDSVSGETYKGRKVPTDEDSTHWRDVFYNELMMAGLGADIFHPISIVTVQALADLGYKVDVTQADRYRFPATKRAIGFHKILCGLQRRTP